MALVTSLDVITGALGWSDTTDNPVAIVLELPAASVATPAATLIVTVPSAAGVIVAV